MRENSWSVQRLRTAMRIETETSLHHAREAQRLQAIINRKLRLKEQRSPRASKGGPTESDQNRPYCKPDQSCCDFVCGN